MAKLPIATVIALVDAGASADPRGQEGVALLTARALAEGTQRSDGAELAARFERLGTALDAGADWDSATLRITATSERFAAALALLAEVIRVPSFPEREVERPGRNASPSCCSSRQSHGGSRTTCSASFRTPRNRVMHCPMAARADRGRAQPGAVRAFYDERYTPSSTTVIIVGDTTVERAHGRCGRRVRFVDRR